MNITYAKYIKDIKKILIKYESVYLYGAGTYAQIVLDKLGSLKSNIKSIVVTSWREIPKRFMIYLL